MTEDILWVFAVHTDKFQGSTSYQTTTTSLRINIINNKDSRYGVKRRLGVAAAGPTTIFIHPSVSIPHGPSHTVELQQYDLVAVQTTLIHCCH